MQRLVIIFLAIFIISACEETSTTVITVKQENINRAITDSIIYHIESNEGQISMKGDLDLIEGECSLTLLAPSGDTLFEPDTLFIPDTIFSIDSIHLQDTIFSIDSIYIKDTLFTQDTILQYNVVYNKYITSPNILTINEKFDRNIGKWIFRYKIIKVGDTNPSGNFDINFIYND